MSEGHSNARVQPALLFQVIDLLVLYILHCTNANHSRRGAERVLKAKVRTGMIQEALLQRTFRDYAQVSTPAHEYSSRAGCLKNTHWLIFFTFFNQT